MNKGMPGEENSDIVQALIATPFKLQPAETRLDILTIGRPKHGLIITSKQGEKPSPLFNGSWYDVHSWLCGSVGVNKLFCWPCLLMRPESSCWSSTGFDDYRKLPNFSAKHSSSKLHLKAVDEYNSSMAEVGLMADMSEIKVQPPESESESDSEFLRRFLVPKSNNSRERKESNENNISKETLTFRAWQQDKASRSKLRASNDPVLVRRKRRLARIEVENAKLTQRLIQLEIQLLEAKLEYQRALNETFPAAANAKTN